MRTNKILSAALIIASLLWGAQVAHASDPVSISSVGHMDNDTGFVLNIPEIHKYNSNLPKESFFSTTSSSGFNASGIVDCAFVINNSDGSHDIIVSGAVISTAESGSLVPPGLSQYNLTNNQYYGR